jgi:hypothetical protein
MLIASGGQLIGSNPISAVIVAIILYVLGILVIRRVTEAENGGDWLRKAMTVCLILHLVGAPLQIWIVNHLYGGIADFNRYDSQGAALAGGFRHFDFGIPPGVVGGIVSNGAVSIVAGVVFAIVGTNQAAGFLVMSWLAFIGIVFFYRAFTVTFNGKGNRRYGYLVFFLPSLILWTSDISKEAMMTFLLGIAAYGCARILAGQSTIGCWLLILAASAGAAFIRPNEMLLEIGGFTVAMLFRPMGSNTQFQAGRRATSMVFMGVMVAVAVFVTLHFLPGLHGSVDLNGLSKGNSGKGEGLGSSGVAYSSSPLFYPRDVYTVMFDPLPFNAHGGGQLLEAAQNTLMLVVIWKSRRNLRLLPRASLARPYLIMCFVYVLAFFYAFAALGNLGLITREATLNLPFLLVLLCIPRAPRGQPPRYIWELSRHERAVRRRAALARASGPAGRAGS